MNDNSSYLSLRAIRKMETHRGYASHGIPVVIGKTEYKYALRSWYAGRLWPRSWLEMHQEGRYPVAATDHQFVQQKSSNRQIEISDKKQRRQWIIQPLISLSRTMVFFYFASFSCKETTYPLPRALPSTMKRCLGREDRAGRRSIIAKT